VIRERARALRAIGEQKSREFRASQAGLAMRVLTLARGGSDWTEALSGNYLKVRVAGRHAANQWHCASIAPNADKILPAQTI
jgi:hypothetical protein